LQPPAEAEAPVWGEGEPPSVPEPPLCAGAGNEHAARATCGDGSAHKGELLVPNGAVLPPALGLLLMPLPPLPPLLLTLPLKVAGKHAFPPEASKIVAINRNRIIASSKVPFRTLYGISGLLAKSMSFFCEFTEKNNFPNNVPL
jgi:hypothetical protein